MKYCHWKWIKSASFHVKYIKICCFWTCLQTCYTILEVKTGGGDHHTKFPMFCWPSIVILCLLLVHSQSSTVYHLCHLMSLEGNNFVYSCSWYLVITYTHIKNAILFYVNLLYIFCSGRWPFAASYGLEYYLLLILWCMLSNKLPPFVCKRSPFVAIDGSQYYLLVYVVKYNTIFCSGKVTFCGY